MIHSIAKNLSHIKQNPQQLPRDDTDRQASQNQSLSVAWKTLTGRLADRNGLKGKKGVAAVNNCTDTLTKLTDRKSEVRQIESVMQRFTVQIMTDEMQRVKKSL